MPVNGGCWAPLVDYLPETITPRGPLHRYSTHTHLAHSHPQKLLTENRFRFRPVMLVISSRSAESAKPGILSHRGVAPPHRWPEHNSSRENEYERGFTHLSCPLSQHLQNHENEIQAGFMMHVLTIPYRRAGCCTYYWILMQANALCVSGGCHVNCPSFLRWIVWGLLCAILSLAHSLNSSHTDDKTNKR